jgi:phage shock protein C
MTATLTDLIRRDDTFFGVCQAIGDDFGFNPNWLRVGLALPVIFNPWLSLAIYGALALTVVASRMLVPARARVAPSVETNIPVAVAASPDAANDELVLARAA